MFSTFSWLSTPETTATHELPWISILGKAEILRRDNSHGGCGSVLREGVRWKSCPPFERFYSRYPFDQGQFRTFGLSHKCAWHPRKVADIIRFLALYRLRQHRLGKDLAEASAFRNIRLKSYMSDAIRDWGCDMLQDRALVEAIITFYEHSPKYC